MGDDGTIHWPKIRPGRSAIWHFDGEINTADPLNKKLLSAFGNVKSFPLDRIIIQFWRVTETTGGKRFLSCRFNPYAFSRVNRLLKKYRSGCIKYRYGIDLADQGDAMTIIDAPPFSAFRNYFPEVVLDLSVHKGTPLVDLALECELTCFMMLPLFDQTNCRGVIEVSTRFPGHLVVIFNELSRVLQRQVLSINPPEYQNYGWLRSSMATISGLRPAILEIFKALQVAVESHGITLGQAWNPSLNPKGRKRVGWWLLDRVCYYHVVKPDDNLSFIRLFYDNFPVLLIKIGEGLIGRALETHQPHLCRNNFKENKGILGLLTANSNAKSYTCFVICLRSSHTGELDYAFEFFWPQSSNHLALIEGLLLALREHMPSFKYASGAQLGDEILVVDVNNSSSSSSAPLKIFPGNKVSKTPKTSVGRMRKFIDEGPSELTYPEDDDDDLVIFAVYKIYQRLFYLPSSTTFEEVLKKVKHEFEDELNPAASYKVRYQVLPGEWFNLTDAACLKTCISSYLTSNNIYYIKFYVQEVQE